jgi:hypothetical protein
MCRLSSVGQLSTIDVSSYQECKKSAYSTFFQDFLAEAPNGIKQVAARCKTIVTVGEGKSFNNIHSSRDNGRFR